MLLISTAKKKMIKIECIKFCIGIIKNTECTSKLTSQVNKLNSSINYTETMKHKMKQMHDHNYKTVIYTVQIQLHMIFKFYLIKKAALNFFFIKYT